VLSQLVCVRFLVAVFGRDVAGLALPAATLIAIAAASAGLAWLVDQAGGGGMGSLIAGATLGSALAVGLLWQADLRLELGLRRVAIGIVPQLSGMLGGSPR
jgi:hypothetical protein